MNRLMLRTLATLGAVMALILTSIAPAVAITGGDADRTGHPIVGLIIFYLSLIHISEPTRPY